MRIALLVIGGVAMIGLIGFAVVSCAALQGGGVDWEGVDAEADAAEANALIRAVGGEAAHEVVAEGPRWVSGPCEIDGPLPVGYPRPTAPGAIEIKEYPSVRRAQYEGTGEAMRARSGFMPLFRHIARNDIAMTVPVEAEYGAGGGDLFPDLEERERGWRMTFLYREPGLGPVGEGEGDVEVVDTERVTVLAVGVRGQMSEAKLEEMEGVLEEWLAENPGWLHDERERRWVMYSGPMTPRRNHWWEVQFLIEPAEAEAEAVVEDRGEGA